MLKITEKTKVFVPCPAGACTGGAELLHQLVDFNRVLIGRWVTISDNNHGYTDMLSLQKPPIEREWVSKGPVIIEDNVWIGDKATILANVTIGKGAVVAANSVVTKDVPAYSVVAGIPAKVIKTN